MNELKRQFASALLVILTAAALVSAFINFQQNFQSRKRYKLPDDGATWVDRPAAKGKNSVAALQIAQASPAENAGVRPGDILLSIKGLPIENSLEVAQVLLRIGPWGTATYLVHRGGVDVRINVIVGERQPGSAVLYQYGVGLAYLLIGLFVYFRRGNSAKSMHFLVLCLANFVLSTFHYTGKLNTFDQVVFLASVAAGLVAPSIFLHFCLTFPEPRGLFRRRWVRVALYAPSVIFLVVYLLFAQGNLKTNLSGIEVLWILDRASIAFFVCLTWLGAVVLAYEHHRAEDAIVRQQLKWLRNGVIAAMAPFTVFYAIPYILGWRPDQYQQMTVVFLLILPVTWAYAIVRYRLMDVDVIFQQGYVYTLATVGVLGVFYLLFVAIGRIEDLSPTAVVTLILVATFVFQPIRNWMQEVLDRHYFYPEQYDYRLTLVEFARELSSETDLDKMLESVADRLKRTLLVQKVGIFLREDPTEADGSFKLRLLTTQKEPHHHAETLAPALDLSFLPSDSQEPYIFFERTRHSIDVVFRDLPASVRHTISDLDLTYYLPCRVRGRTIAYLGTSRTTKNEFLSSDDLELLITLSGYVGIAVENARLYWSLQQKAGEYERLKEFSENIVESINVGVLAADLQDRVESWNTEIERMTGIPRKTAVGCRLEDLFEAELCSKFDEVRGQTGIHNIYKFALRPQGKVGKLLESGFPVAASNGHSDSSGTLCDDPLNALNGTLPALRNEPKETIVNLAIAPLVAKDQRQIGRLIIFDDITDRSELERRLVQADKLSSIGLLAAGVAHEVNTPLAVISTYAQMLAKQVSGDDQKSKLLERIAKQTFRASEIVNSLLNFSRTSPAEFADVDLNKVVSETVSLVSHQLQRASVRVQLSLEESLPPIKGNSGKLQQVFLNLVLNARDAMEGGGGLDIRTESKGSFASIHVSDTGQGISPEHLQRIYDPFFTTKAQRKGTGLGLSVTYGIVREHGGTIEVQSEPGTGTIFHLQFPLANQPVNV